MPITTLNVRNLNDVLDEANPLPGMGIKIKEVSRDGDKAVYVAEISGKSPGKVMLPAIITPI